MPHLELTLLCGNGCDDLDRFIVNGSESPSSVFSCAFEQKMYSCWQTSKPKSCLESFDTSYQQTFSVSIRLQWRPQSADALLTSSLNPALMASLVDWPVTIRESQTLGTKTSPMSFAYLLLQYKSQQSHVLENTECHSIYEESLWAGKYLLIKIGRSP